MKGLTRPQLSTLNALAAALVALPMVQLLPLDYDRTGALVLLVPTLWFGRRELAGGAVALLSRSRLYSWLACLAGTGIAAAAVTADHPAPAAVLVSVWLLLAAAGLIASQLVALEPAAARRLLSAIAIGAAAGTLATWTLWLVTGRGDIPLYAHQRHLGLHGLVGALAATAVLVQARRTSGTRARITWFAVGAVTWAGLLWSGSRMPVLAAAGGLAVWWCMRATDRRVLVLATSLPAVAGLAISALFWTDRPELGWWNAINRTTVAVASPNASVSELTSTRTDVWRSVIHHASASPWLGRGPDGYRFLVPKLDGQQPHNLLLQLWIDVGLLGGVPVLTLLGLGLLRSWRRAADAPQTSFLPGSLALVTGCVLGSFLDGVFYHLLAFLPGMVALGIGVAASPDRPAVRRADRSIRTIAAIALGAAVSVLAFHAWLWHRLTIVPAPPPDSAATRALRSFPTTTFGLWNWIETWRQDHPDAALQWARWAQTRSPNPVLFHVRAADLLLARGDRAAARNELLEARAKVHWTNRPAIDAMIANLDAASR